MTYAEWIARYDTLPPQRRISLQQSLAQLVRHPLISILLPVYNPDSWAPHANPIFGWSGRRDQTRAPNEADYLGNCWGRQLSAKRFYNLNLVFDPSGFTLVWSPRS